MLSFRAVNSLKNVFGASTAASLTLRTSASASVSSVTAVTLTGSFCGSWGSFCAVTVTGGSVTRSGGCAPAPAGAARIASRMQPARAGSRLKGNIHGFCHMFLYSGVSAA